jgi:large subunit ribosomal protein L30
MSSDASIRVTLVRSLRGCREDHRATVRGLGLRRLNHTVQVGDTPAIRGMLRKVNYLLRVERDPS